MKKILQKFLHKGYLYWIFNLEGIRVWAPLNLNSDGLDSGGEMKMKWPILETGLQA